MSKLSEMGEKEAVRRILAEIAEKESSNAIGPGDDAAAVDMGFVYLVATTDLIAQSTHVLPGMTDWQIGWTVAAVNFSDVAAMGAKPIGLLVSMGLPKDTALREAGRDNPRHPGLLRMRWRGDARRGHQGSS